MALRTFRSNPSLGGFGSESTAPLLAAHNNINNTVAEDCDAFAQIIKELVDNAVDACSSNAVSSPQEYKRVRVYIDRFVADDGQPSRNQKDGEEEEEETDDNDNKNEILRVTVIDNGCGMANIQDCVEAFSSTKAGDAQERTAGRYGIGLTLCLLHAQRLVPNFCASITSATSACPKFTKAQLVVDTQRDRVKCVDQVRVDKRTQDESGTSVCLLVPGGLAAQLAWGRLAEYFTNFQLSLGLQCSLEVMAPTLSKVPLLVKPPLEEKRKKQRRQQKEAETNIHKDEEDKEDEENWGGVFDDEDNDKDEEQLTVGINDTQQQSQPATLVSQDSQEAVAPKPPTKKELQEQHRRDIHRAVELYLGRPVDVNNVAHSRQPIRINTKSGTKRRCKKGMPGLEVAFVVCGVPEETPEEEDDDDQNLDPEAATQPENAIETAATMTMVRMVNRIPLLDGAEATSCGLIQGILRKRKVWNSFGLEVNSAGGLFPLPSEETKVPSQLPTFQVRDSDQVAPFMKSANHALFDEDPFPEEEEQSEDEIGSDVDVEDLFGQGRRRRRRKKKSRKWLLPAHVRLGKILVIVQIEAEPSSLPLPTLSKGRLPSDNLAIDKALEVGLLECLRGLQKTNPSLLLTAPQLKRAERDVRYVPQVAASIGSIVARSTNADFRDNMMRIIERWGRKEGPGEGTGTSNDEDEIAAEGEREVYDEEGAEQELGGIDSDVGEQIEGAHSTERGLTADDIQEEMTSRQADYFRESQGTAGDANENDNLEAVEAEEVGSTMNDENADPTNRREMQQLVCDLGEQIESRLRLVLTSHDEEVAKKKEEKKKSKKKTNKRAKKDGAGAVEAETVPDDSSDRGKRGRKRATDREDDDQSQRSYSTLDLTASSQDSPDRRSSSSPKPATYSDESDYGDYHDESSMASTASRLNNHKDDSSVESLSPQRVAAHDNHIENDDDWLFA